MKIFQRATAVAVLSVATLFCTSAVAQRMSTCGASLADSPDVVQAMRTMYVAATKDDLNLFHSVAAPGFYAFDNGKRYDGDALMQLAKSLHAQGDVIEWRVTDPQVQVDCNTAWITYVNRGSLTIKSGTTPLEWLESAVLQKKSGHWRILFFHSTRVPQA